MNLVGWGATGLVLFVILQRLTPTPHGSQRFALAVYLINFALPLGFCILNRYWLAALLGPLSMAMAWLVLGHLWHGTAILRRLDVDIPRAGRSPRVPSSFKKRI